MTHKLFAISTLAAALLCAALPAQAAPAGQVAQLSGFVLATRPAGPVKVLATRSAVEQGDTLATQPATYLRVALAGGGEVLMGPDTRLRLEAGKLVLLQGQLRLTAAPGVPLLLEAGASQLTATAATVDLSFVPDTAAATAQRAYARAAMAATAGPLTDIPAETVLWQMAQGPLPAVPTQGRAPGLYVSVIDGLIRVTNPVGTTNFSAGQFGYTSSFQQPPVPLPSNPGIPFTLPPAFQTTSSSGPSSSTGANKSNTVDCEVR